MSFMDKLHNYSIRALNLCAVATLISLAINIFSAAAMYILDHKKQENR